MNSKNIKNKQSSKIVKVVNESINISEKVNSVRGFYKKHYWVLIIQIVVNILLFYLASYLGIIGLVLNIFLAILFSKYLPPFRESKKEKF